MLQDHRGAKSQDDIRGFLVFLTNPLFSDSSTYVIYAHVLRQICALDADEQQVTLSAIACVIYFSDQSGKK